MVRMPARLSMLDRKLLRDLWDMKGQSLAIAAVIAAGVTMFVAMLSNFDSLWRMRADFYERARFADVFAGLKRAPASLQPRLAEIPGVQTVATRVVAEVTLDVPGMRAPAAAGDPLLEIGDPHRLEIVADVLSTDAVKARPGARAIVEQWGGDKVLEARVRRVEPSGFTKISALGVEEQRVNIVLDFLDPAAAWAALGDAYRVEVRVVIWESQDVLKVPTSALFRDGEKWAVFIETDGRARRTVVDIGHQTGQEAEVLSGLAEGARVLLHPGDTVSDGVRVRPRSL